VPKPKNKRDEKKYFENSALTRIFKIRYLGVKIGFLGYPILAVQTRQNILKIQEKFQNYFLIRKSDIFWVVQTGP